MPMTNRCKHLLAAVAVGLIVFTLQEADAQCQLSNNVRYMIVHRLSNKVLTSTSSMTSQGTLILTDRNGSVSQQWVFSVIGSYYTIANSATGRYLDGDGSAAYTYTYNGNNHQQWSVILVFGYWFRLEQRQTGDVLDANHDGTSVYMGSYNGGHFQQWELAVNCGNLTNPANGRVSHTDGTTFEQTATYSCYTGYNLVGDSNRTCQSTGQWSGSAPTCQVLNCGTLTNPANGQVSHNAGTTLGQTATYSCNTGYNLVGARVRTCQATRGWSGSVPACQIVDCGTLTNPANSQVSYTGGTTFGETATYSCDAGYSLVGNSIRTCQGVWSGSEPTCQAVDCDTLTDPANGQVSHSGTTLGQTANYSCNTGYNLVGSSTRMCQATAVWSGCAPACQAVDCGTLNNLANGQVSYTGRTTLGQTATYSCNTGYNLVGDNIRTCQATGNWSDSAPTCQAMDCDTLTDPANGQVSHPRTTVGQTATYRCNTGYNLVGSSTRMCQATGWLGCAPTCQAVDCGTLNNPSNGRVSYTGRTTFGQTAIYSCITGYSLVGGNTSTCQATGNWSDSAPTCQDLNECSRGTYTCHNNATCKNTEGSYTCSCNTGYIGNGFSCTASNTSASTTLTQDDFSPVIGVVVGVAGVLMAITTALIIVVCVMMKRRQALNITSPPPTQVAFRNMASLDTKEKQMDIEIKDELEYEIADPPSMMRMKENEAYDTQQQQMDTKKKEESEYEIADPPSMMRMKENTVN